MTDTPKPMPQDTLRQEAFVVLSRLQSGTENVVRLDVALAALAAERERCAGLCEGIAATVAESSNGVRKVAAVATAQSCARLIRRMS